MNAIERIAEILGKLDATDCSSEMAIAQYTLSNMVGYRAGSKYRNSDAIALALILQAYAKLLQENGVKVA